VVGAAAYGFFSGLLDYLSWFGCLDGTGAPLGA